jgi:plasmid stabilization system protein ParE
LIADEDHVAPNGARGYRKCPKLHRGLRPKASRRIVETTAAVSRQPNTPEIGRPGRVAGTRELVVSRTPYIAAYQVADGEIVILDVLHGAQKWPGVF